VRHVHNLTTGGRGQTRIGLAAPRVHN
jgi:hypothetical protein